MTTRWYDQQADEYYRKQQFKKDQMEKESRGKMSAEKQHFAKYTRGKSSPVTNDLVLKDGHQMFTFDIVQDLNRKSFLEEEVLNLRKELLEVTAKADDMQTELNRLLQEYNL